MGRQAADFLAYQVRRLMHRPRLTFWGPEAPSERPHAQYIAVLPRAVSFRRHRFCRCPLRLSSRDSNLEGHLHGTLELQYWAATFTDHDRV